MKVGIIFFGTVLLSVATFAGQNTTPSAAATASAVARTSGQSRIRMYGQNGAKAQIFPGLSCVKSSLWGKDGIRVSGGMGQAFISFIGASSNISLGMPETEVSRNVSRKDGILSKAYYQEHVIPSGQVTSLAVGFQDVAAFHTTKVYGITTTYKAMVPSCFNAISFIPEAGMDYEVGFQMQAGECYVGVFRLQKTDANTETEMIPVPIEPVGEC